MISKLQEKNQHAFAQIDDSIKSVDKNMAQGDLGYMLAESKENGVKLGIENLSKNIGKIEETVISIASLELDKPHPDTKFNEDKEFVELEKTTGVIESKLDGIKRFYVNLHKEDDEIEMVQSELAGIKDSV